MNPLPNILQRVFLTLCHPLDFVTVIIHHARGSSVKVIHVKIILKTKKSFCTARQ